jgi:hypothetical protein
MGSTKVTDEAIKIREFKHKTLGNVKAAFCGAVLAVEPWIAHMVEHGFAPFELPEDLEDCGISSILVTVDRNAGTAYETDHTGMYHKVVQPLAYGSGCVVAQHYLTTGHDALTAVRETIKTNVTCGGRILAYDTKTKKYHSYVR